MTASEMRLAAVDRSASRLRGVLINAHGPDDMLDSVDQDRLGGTNYEPSPELCRAWILSRQHHIRRAKLEDISLPEEFGEAAADCFLDGCPLGLSLVGPRGEKLLDVAEAVVKLWTNADGKRLNVIPAPNGARHNHN